MNYSFNFLLLAAKSTLETKITLLTAEKIALEVKR